MCGVDWNDPESDRPFGDGPASIWSPLYLRFNRGFLKPRWVEVQGILYVGAVIIKAYRNRDAGSQVAVLRIFERQGWPPSIANPFVGYKSDADSDYYERLRSTIKQLNAAHLTLTPVLQFYVKAKRPAWRLLPLPDESRPVRPMGLGHHPSRAKPGPANDDVQ